MSPVDFFQNINWFAPSWDLIIGLFFVVFVLLYGLSLGKERSLVMLASTYIGYAVASNLPFIDDALSKSINLGSVQTLKLAVFLITMVSLFVLFARTGVFGGGGGQSVILTMVLSIFHVGLFISIVFSFLPLDFVEQFSTFIKIVFDSDLAHFVWLLAPVFGLYLAKGGD